MELRLFQPPGGLGSRTFRPLIIPASVYQTAGTSWRKMRSYFSYGNGLCERNRRNPGKPGKARANLKRCSPGY